MTALPIPGASGELAGHEKNHPEHKMQVRAYLESLPSALMRQCADRLQSAWTDDEIWLLAQLELQQLSLLRGQDSLVQAYQMSSARRGHGNLLDSERTPLGLHEVCEKIGEGLAKGAVLRHRRATGEIADRPGSADPDVSARITSRILRLRGLNPGFNLGKDGEGNCVDSYDRYIYIHGTDRPFEPGQQTSMGCLTLHDEDIIDLYDRVLPGSLILIAFTKAPVPTID